MLEKYFLRKCSTIITIFPEWVNRFWCNLFALDAVLRGKGWLIFVIYGNLCFATKFLKVWCVKSFQIFRKTKFDGNQSNAINCVSIGQAVQTKEDIVFCSYCQCQNSFISEMISQIKYSNRQSFYLSIK